MAKQLWRLERQFWSGDATFYEGFLAEEALMVFPPPVGCLDRSATVSSIRSAPRWLNVVFENQFLLEPVADIKILVYIARADRGDADSRYVAQCSSVYIRQPEWCLALHQQTPLNPSEK